MSENSSITEDPLLTVKIIYGLFAGGYLTGGLTSIAGVIFAYVERGKDEMADTHLNYQIKTFWISLVVGLIGVITAFIGIGFLILLGLAIWGIVRLVSGFILVMDNKPISNVQYLGAYAS